MWSWQNRWIGIFDIPCMQIIMDSLLSSLEYSYRFVDGRFLVRPTCTLRFGYTAKDTGGCFWIPKWPMQSGGIPWIYRIVKTQYFNRKSLKILNSTGTWRSSNMRTIYIDLSDLDLSGVVIYIYIYIYFFCQQPRTFRTLPVVVGCFSKASTPGVLVQNIIQPKNNPDHEIWIWINQSFLGTLCIWI